MVEGTERQLAAAMAAGSPLEAEALQAEARSLRQEMEAVSKLHTLQEHEDSGASADDIGSPKLSPVARISGSFGAIDKETQISGTGPLKGRTSGEDNSLGASQANEDLSDLGRPLHCCIHNLSLMAGSPSMRFWRGLQNSTTACPF